MTFNRAAAPAPAVEPPVWTLPGELAKLLTPRSPSPAQRSQTQRAERDPAMPERRRQSRAAAFDGGGAQPGPPASLERNPIRASTPMPPLPAVSNRSLALTLAPPADRAMRRTAAACLVGVLVVLAGASWLQQHADGSDPGTARLDAPQRPAPAATVEAAAPSLATLPEPMPQPSTFAAPSPKPQSSAQQFSVRRIPRPAVAAARLQPDTAGCCAPTAHASLGRCSELLLGQSLGDGRSPVDANPLGNASGASPIPDRSCADLPTTHPRP